ncbi:MAG: alpha/beta hydrolase [Vicinamibacterales bacterium]|nr:alpha/beta hydrolase [Vicinamibacterales bacterium]
MLLFTAALLAVCLILLGTLLVWSHPGTPRPFVDAAGLRLPGSISEKIRVVINGAEQGMFITGRDRTNPVLLYLHGGMPEYFLTEHYPTGLEALFTVVWWEQRGSGLSYRADASPDTVTVEQLIADTIALARYLRERFHTEKVYLMAHSGGTFIGIQAAQRAPELFHAYLGVAQMSHQLASERRAYEYMLEQFRARKNGRMVRRLEAAPVTMTGGTPPAYLALRDEAMHQLGIGTTRDMTSVMTGVFLRSLRSREYTLSEKLNLWRGKARAGVSAQWATMLATDLKETVPELDIPVYFFSGVHDYTCSYVEARSYFEQLRAPRKRFYSFEHSAHSPMFEEPERMQQILRDDVLAGGQRIAEVR